ncbi:hypothetical protein [Tolypothrix sp. VBCCA 56010]|uniref:hypothetical protein n=1 Tax=Tolypothrix sp. VBCCA 56010 TaxID=3137731 RepID=UPI003D7C8096
MQGDYPKSFYSDRPTEMQNIRIAASPHTSGFAPSKPTFLCNLISLTFRQILKKNKRHFFIKKNDILYTELNFAIFWSSPDKPTPDFRPLNLPEMVFVDAFKGSLSTT